MTENVTVNIPIQAAVDSIFKYIVIGESASAAAAAVAVGVVDGNVSEVESSADTGATWTSRAHGYGEGVTFGVAASPTEFVTIGTDFTDIIVQSSSDGVTWNTETTGIGLFANGSNMGSVAYGNGIWVILAQDDTSNDIRTRRSTNVTSWTDTVVHNAFEPGLNAPSLHYLNDRFFLIGGAFDGSGGIYQTSTDGITWSSVTPIPGFSDSNARPLGAVYSLGLYVIAGFSPGVGLIETSPDASSWTLRTPASLTNIQDITFGAGVFVAVGLHFTTPCIEVSSDGITWNSVTNPFASGLSCVTFANGIFIAGSLGTAGSGEIGTSPDGTNWTLRTTDFGTESRVYDIAGQP